ncbi:NAD(P)-dependent oxidoreductase [Paucibacter sp. B2R-40]|uniref:NAD-dependent epimerase/dehydratase family protein n=1 Tax=Paucibacter sp. B2R-40 TaxID=2893554 RepID=UPI0021E38DCD|nr:NAD(P)-dependent oxidoreductase [Paucibacter sp. B2R-40]MCV2354524.1 NAD(P)-dependent oxidoreductase [Paucibacter sp. B2R-40]
MSTLPRSEALDLRGRWIFITGGTGFIGRSLLDYFDESATKNGPNFQVTVLSRNPASFLHRHPWYESKPWLNFVRGELNDLQLNSGKFTDLIHAAADTHRRGDPLEWLDQLVNGTRQVLDFARYHGVKRFLLLSSGAAYGTQPADVAALEEDMPLAPLTNNTRAVYGNGKRTAEHLCALYSVQYEIECVIARCFAVISKHVPLDGPYAAGNFLRDAMQGSNICVHGNGRAIRSYIDGRDAAHWLTTLLSIGKAGEIYNVGSEKPISILQLAEIVRARTSCNGAVTSNPGEKDITQSIYLPSTAKAQALGLSIETTLEDSIDTAIEGIKAIQR